MAVEASINSKKATPLLKQNIIGKGITTLDDFNEFGAVSAEYLHLVYSLLPMLTLEITLCHVKKKVRNNSH